MILKKILKETCSMLIFYLIIIQNFFTSSLSCSITKKDYIECFQGEYEFGGRDWYTGEYWSITLSESIWYNERLQVAFLKRQKLPIPAEFQDQESE